jgi:hypothetical protein
MTDTVLRRRPPVHRSAAAGAARPEEEGILADEEFEAEKDTILQGG